jgi:hypothetical protein
MELRAEIEKFETIIVGMGPVGLALAYNFALTWPNKKLLIIEKRSEKEVSARPQIVILDSASKMELIDRVRPEDQFDNEDIAFLDALANSSEIKISDIQQFILKRLRYLCEMKNSPIKLQYNADLQEVNLPKGEAIISGHKILFNNLIGADGTKSESLELVNMNLEKNKQIAKFVPAKIEHVENTYHLGAYIKLARADGQNLALPSQSFVISYLRNKDPQTKKKFANHYFLRFDRASFIKSKLKSVKLSFIGEIPEYLYDRFRHVDKSLDRRIEEALNIHKIFVDEIHGLKAEIGAFNVKIANDHDPSLKKLLTEKQERYQNLISSKESSEKNLTLLLSRKFEMQLSYIKSAIAHYMGIDQDELIVELSYSENSKKNELKLLQFQGQSRQADKAAIIENGHLFALISDSYFSPHYVLGHGLNNGYASISKLKDLLENKISIIEYDQFLQNKAKEVISALNFIHYYKSLNLPLGAVTGLVNHSLQTLHEACRVNILFKRELDTVLKKFISKKFESHLFISKLNSILNFKTNAPENDINLLEIINDWTDILSRYPNILKLYIRQALDPLNQIKKKIDEIHDNPDNLIKLPSIELKEILNTINSFNWAYARYSRLFDSYKMELISLAEKKAHPVGNNPLFLAIIIEDIDTIQSILNIKCVELNANHGPRLETPLMLAMNNSEIIKLLLEHGADPNYVFHPSLPCPLQYAIKNNASLETIQLLLKYGARLPNISSGDICYKKIKDNPTLICAFINYGLDIFTNGIFHSFLKNNLFSNVTSMLLLACHHEQSPFFNVLLSNLTVEEIGSIIDSIKDYKPKVFLDEVDTEYTKSIFKIFDSDMHSLNDRQRKEYLKKYAVEILLKVKEHIEENSMKKSTRNTNFFHNFLSFSKPKISSFDDCPRKGPGSSNS